jgi:hypothetical protein
MNFSKLHRCVVENFPSNLDIVGVCDILEHDTSWKSLFQCFAPFRAHVFATNQRFLILHHDTDYYPSMSSCGNSIYNIIKIIAELDISTDHIIILSASLGTLKTEVEYQCKINNLSVIQTIDFSLWYTWPFDADAKVSEQSDKTHLFSCLNGVARTHRKTLLALLYQQDLINCGILSWNPNGNNQVPRQTDSANLDSISTFRITVPASRVNEELSICPISKSLQVQYQSQLDTSIKTELIAGGPNSWETRWVANYLQHSLVYIVSETVGQYPHVYISEKTWKAMMSFMPFMILGAPGTISQLQQMGFLTFGDFWDESYDNINNLYERAALIVANLRTLRNKDWNKLYQMVRPILLHNYHHIKTYQESELNKIRNLI